MRLASLFLVSGFVACTFPNYSLEQDPSAVLARICSDGFPSPAETGVDCGGGCPPCHEDGPCEIPGDCLTLACLDGRCRAATCHDEIVNGSESDRDCGGQCGLRCEAGRYCRSSADCSSGVCVQGSCLAPACDDATRNGDETSVDCGGSCPACSTGSMCAVDADCAGGTCVQPWCVEPGCTDGVLNGTETDVDCGGPACAPCDAGASCSQASDCVTSSCDETLHCVDSVCSDGILNGSETDLDCGGASCARCDVLQRCVTSADCASAVCQSSVCVPTAPTGELISTAGWVGVASHTFSGDAPADVFDGDTATIWSTGTMQEPGMFFEVDLGAVQAFYAVELECSVASDAPVLFDIFLWQAGGPTMPARADIVGFPRTAVEFATPQVARYVRLVLQDTKTAWWCIGELSIRR